jgi:hypothetical protein
MSGGEEDPPAEFGLRQLQFQADLFDAIVDGLRFFAGGGFVPGHGILLSKINHTMLWPHKQGISTGQQENFKKTPKKLDIYLLDIYNISKRSEKEGGYGAGKDD